MSKQWGNGYHTGKTEGFQQGKNAGFQQGKNVGFQQGKNAGFQQGKQQGNATAAAIGLGIIVLSKVAEKTGLTDYAKKVIKNKKF